MLPTEALPKSFLLSQLLSGVLEFLGLQPLLVSQSWFSCRRRCAHAEAVIDEIDCRLRRRSSAASRERMSSRTASRASPGTHTAVNLSARLSFASLIESRRFVFTRRLRSL